MNEFTTIREHGPAPTPLTEDVLAKARADLLAEIGAAKPTTVTRRPVRLRLRAAVIAATVAAAAVAAGVVVATSPDRPSVPAIAAKPPVLVEFHMPALPPELRPIPAGVTKPSFTGEPGWIGAIYSDAHSRPGEEASNVNVLVFSSEPSSNGTQHQDTTYAGKPAVLRTLDQQDPVVHQVSLIWERSPGKWIELTGSGAFANEQTVRSLADTLVDTNKTLSLEISVAPAGWELQGFKGAGPDGAGGVTSVRDPANPDRVITVNTMLRLDPHYGQDVEGGPRESTPVSVHGRHGDLVLIPGARWMLQASLPDGQPFQLQVPADFTRQQVIQLAEGVS